MNHAGDASLMVTCRCEGELARTGHGTPDLNRGWGWTPDSGKSGVGVGVDPRSPANRGWDPHPPAIPGKSGMGVGVGIGGSVPCARCRGDSHRHQPRPERLFTRSQVSTERSAFHHNDAAIFVTRWHLMPVPNLKIRPILACVSARTWLEVRGTSRTMDLLIGHKPEAI